MTGRASVLALIAAVAVAACSETVTQPMLTSRADISPDIGFIAATPPPPPIDTGAIVSTDQGAFTVQTTYFLNKTGTNGFISFANHQQSDGVAVDPNARISLHNGTLSGQGSITLLASGGVITIDLSQGVNPKSTSFNPDCSKSCATVGFTGTFTPKGHAPIPTSGTITVGASGTPGT